MELDSRLVCAACGAEPPADAPFACPRAGLDAADHLIVRRLDRAAPIALDGDTHPFLRWRHRFAAWHAWRRAGRSDADYLALVTALDRRVAEVDGAGFHITPLTAQPALAAALGHRGPLHVKDETHHVSGSHKARHLFGVMVHLRVLETLAGTGPAARRPLAISSCGNAALAAAVVARAADWPLEVFVPPHAEAAVLARLTELGATIHPCPRLPGTSGDPCTLGFRDAVRAGALPFSCQGPDQGLAIEGGLTLGYELATALVRGEVQAEHLVIQVGGGALGSGIAQGLEEARAAGQLDRLPRIWTVQTEGAWPLARAWEVLTGAGPRDLRPERGAARDHRASRPSGPLRASLAGSTGAGRGDDGLRRGDAAVRGIADRLAADPGLAAALASARADKPRFMWPWETEPHSLAHGILDDETYDWMALLEAMATTGGGPVIASEARIAMALDAARAAGFSPCATGTSGLAGLSALAAGGAIREGEGVLCVITGVDRTPEPGDDS